MPRWPESSRDGTASAAAIDIAPPNAPTAYTLELLATWAATLNRTSELPTRATD